MDKKIFLLDKDKYQEEVVANLSEKDLEEWVAEEDYNGDYTIIKIDANGYNSVQEAIKGEGLICNLEDYYVFTFGF
jgi:hypothetical protein